jgi:hypothetical protein
MASAFPMSVVYAPVDLSAFARRTVGPRPEGIVGRAGLPLRGTDSPQVSLGPTDQDPETRTNFVNPSQIVQSFSAGAGRLVTRGKRRDSLGPEKLTGAARRAAICVHLTCQ